MKSFLPIEGPSLPDFSTLAAPSGPCLGRDLKWMFDSLTAGPMPDRLIELADALEEAFERGELFEPPGIDA